MVMPERLTPGIRASIWDMPIRIASLYVIFSVVFAAGFLSAYQSTMPNIRVVHAITCKVFSQSGCSKCRARPAIITGAELVSKYSKSFDSLLFIFFGPLFFTMLAAICAAPFIM